MVGRYSVWDESSTHLGDAYDHSPSVTAIGHRHGGADDFRLNVAPRSRPFVFQESLLPAESNQTDKLIAVWH